MIHQKQNQTFFFAFYHAIFKITHKGSIFEMNETLTALIFAIGLLFVGLTVVYSSPEANQVPSYTPWFVSSIPNSLRNGYWEYKRSLEAIMITKFKVKSCSKSCSVCYLLAARKLIERLGCVFPLGVLQTDYFSRFSEHLTSCTVHAICSSTTTSFLCQRINWKALKDHRCSCCETNTRRFFVNYQWRFDLWVTIMIFKISQSSPR